MQMLLHNHLFLRIIIQIFSKQHFDEENSSKNQINIVQICSNTENRPIDPTEIIVISRVTYFIFRCKYYLYKQKNEFGRPSDMKATGIVRRIDDLGRVVIPKEIRRTMRIREGDPLEVYTDRDGEVIFKKYSPMGELGTFVGELAEALSRTAGLSCAICDRDAVIAAAGGAKKEILEKSISSDLELLMEKRSIYEHKGSDTGVTLSGSTPHHVLVAAPIISEGDVTGCVAFLSEDAAAEPTEVESKLSQTAASFLAKHVTM